MRVGIIELLVDTPSAGWPDRLYAAYFRKQLISIMPQAVAVWCRELGHDVHYTTYYGQHDPTRLLPDELDVVFVATYTQASALAYALDKLYRRQGTLTVIGGPHATSFPRDCLRFFDLVVGACDKRLVDDILRGHFDPPATIASGRPATDLPSVEERMPEIAISAFSRGRPNLTSVVPVLASIGCPYACDFCIEWNKPYTALPKERLAADLRFILESYPGALVIYHDPNFAVRFDETMDIIEAVPEGRRNSYGMESSLSILKESRLHRLRRTNCLYVAPGIESWTEYSNKAGVGDKSGQQKLAQIVDHLDLLGEYVPSMQANLMFGSDADRGREPAELTKEFIRRVPAVFPVVNIPTPFGGKPLHDRYLAEGRVLRSLPFAFYYNPYLAAVVKHYHPLEYCDHLIDIHETMASHAMLARRLVTGPSATVRFIHALRTVGVRADLAELRRIRAMLASDAGFRAFHEGRSDALPAYYHRRLEERLRRYAELVSRADRTPVHEAPATPEAAPTPALAGC